MNAYKAALLDWLACAYGGRNLCGIRPATGSPLETVTWLGAAGHVLDFDDTYLPGIAHLSAPTAPSAIVMAARLQLSIGDALEAYAAGFEAMGRLSRSHRLYEGPWHPTAVCGSVGAAVAAVRLLAPHEESEANAVKLALLRAGGLRAAFGSRGKALQVGMAAAAGFQAATLDAEITADVMDAPDGFAAAFGERLEDDGRPAIEENWIKPWPCCLMSHSAVEATSRAKDEIVRARSVEVVVHPVARRAAAYDDVVDGLQAKFSIPYLVAFVAICGEPEPWHFDGVEEQAREFARERVRVTTDDALGETEAVLIADGKEVARVAASLGSPQRPMTTDQLASKCELLAGDALIGVLDDLDAPAQTLLNLFSKS